MARTFTYSTLLGLEVRLQKQADEPFTMIVRYTLGADGAPALTDFVEITLTPAQVTQLRTFIENTVIPAIKTKEGIV